MPHLNNDRLLCNKTSRIHGAHLHTVPSYMLLEMSSVREHCSLSREIKQVDL